MLGRRNGHLGSLSTAGDQPIYSLRQASLSVRDDDVFHLLLDIEVLLGLRVSWIVGVLFTGATFALVIGLGLFLTEIRLATRAYRAGR